MSAPTYNIFELLHSMQSSISDVEALATANMLKLNDNKTELMLITSSRTKHLHDLSTSMLFAQQEMKLMWILVLLHSALQTFFLP